MAILGFKITLDNGHARSGDQVHLFQTRQCLHGLPDFTQFHHGLCLVCCSRLGEHQIHIWVVQTQPRWETPLQIDRHVLVQLLKKLGQLVQQTQLALHGIKNDTFVLIQQMPDCPWGRWLAVRPLIVQFGVHISEFFFYLFVLFFLVLLLKVVVILNVTTELIPVELRYIALRIRMWWWMRIAYRFIFMFDTLIIVIFLFLW